MASGYRDIPEADRKKAETFFERGKTVGDAGQYEFAIEMYLLGLGVDPENVEAHQLLRDISFKRKASGGKALGMMEKMKLRSSKDEKTAMLNCEKLLAYDPGNTDHMLCVVQNAHKGGYYDTVMWIGAILLKANAESKSPEFKKFILLRDIYKDLDQWKHAVEACQWAVNLRPDDMDLGTELKNLGAQQTMKAGKYSSGGSFRDSMRDAAGQHKLMDSEKDVRSLDSMTRMITEAEAELATDPNEPGKLMKLIDALKKTEMLEYENRAIELLEDAYRRTQQFRWKQSAGEIKLLQLKRSERSLITQLQKDPSNEALKKEYLQFVKEKTEEELKEYQLSAENYPTETKFRFYMAVSMFNLKRYDEAIPVFQQARQDPKFRSLAGTLLARAFLEAGYVDEAADTMRENIEQYQARGDDKSKDMHYWYARILEAQNETAAAIKAYSQVAQWDFNFKDVQARIKRLRAAGKPGAEDTSSPKNTVEPPGSPRA